MKKRLTRAWGIGVWGAFAVSWGVLACSSDATVAGAGAATADDAGTSTTVASAKTGVVRFTVTRGPGDVAPLTIGAFTENPPKSRPPSVFDTSKAPAYPYAGSLKGLEPGRYWIVAVLDLPPVTLGALKPGPEDILVTSDAIDVVGDDTHDVTLALPYRTDAVDASTHD